MDHFGKLHVDDAEHERLQRFIREAKRKVLGDKVDDIGKFDFMPVGSTEMVHLQTRE